LDTIDLLAEIDQLVGGMPAKPLLHRPRHPGTFQVRIEEALVAGQ
jgi:hypothetical protein